MTRPVILATSALAAGVLWAGGSELDAHHGAIDRHNPAAVTLDVSQFEDGSARATGRFVLPARVSDVQVRRQLTKRGRVVSFVVTYCYRQHACQEER